MLAGIRHPSIVELLAAFRHGLTYNFIFPLADMDLEALLHQEQRPLAFENDRAFYQAISGLANALENIHNFEYKNQDIVMSQIGFHHDLKPENILVRGRNFQITDFGLSRFSDKKSPMRFKWMGGAETYGPPEIDPEFRRNEDIDSCAVDLWSFGCVIVEIVAFVLEGRYSLANFRKDRLTWHGRSRDDCFHRGKTLKPEVIAAFERYGKLSAPGSAAVQSLDLARRLLDLEPSRRRAIKLTAEASEIALNFQLCGFAERSNDGTNIFNVPLHEAAATGASDGVKALIENGVSITIRDKFRRTALHWAAICGRTTILEQLYEAANATHRKDLNEEVDCQGRTALALASQFANPATVTTIMEEASVQGNLGRIVTRCDAFGMSPLHLASEVGIGDIAKLLLHAAGDKKQRIEYKLLKDDKGMTALHYAARNPEHDLVLHLLYDGEDANAGSNAAVRLTSNCDDEGLAPLAHAEKYGCWGVASLLAEVAGASQTST